MATGGAIKFPVDPTAYGDLFKESAPVSAFMPEAVPYVWYDSQTLVTSWTSAQFFSAPNADKTLSNIEQTNSLSSEQYFVLYTVTADLLMGAAQIDNAAPQQYNDFRIIMDTARAVLTMSMQQKKMFQIPLRHCHAAGGFNAIISGAPAANALANTVQNAPPDGSFWCDGAIIIPPKATFEITLNGVAAALTASRILQIGLVGALYRPVR